MINRILVGYDGSEQASDALFLGARVATLLDSDLVLGASFQDEHLLDGEEPLDLALARESEALFSDAEARLGKAAPSKLTTRAIPRESTADALQDLAAYEKADLMIIGSTHRGALGRVLPGSLALQLIGTTPCPLAIAPQGMVAELEPLTGPIVAAFDGSELAGRAVSFAAELAAQTDGWLHVIGVALSNPQVEAALAGGMPAMGAQLDREALEEALDEHLEQLPADARAQGLVLEGSPVQELVDLASGSRGVLVSGSHGRGPLMSLVLGSVSDAVAQRISWPIVLVPPQARIAAIEATPEKGNATGRQP